MKIVKKDISKNISSNLDLSFKLSSEILESFLSSIKFNVKNKNVKLSNFGTFYIKDTVKRIGRNPKTMENYIIPSFKKITFKSSNKIKSYLN